MEIVQLGTRETSKFLDVIDTLTYKDKDIEEAKQYGHQSIKQLYSAANHRWGEYYLIYDNDKIVCTILLDAYSTLHYFVTIDLTASNALSFVRTIKKLALFKIEQRPVLFIHTSLYYEEAIKFNKLIGFKLVKQDTEDMTSTWYLSKSKGY